MQKEQVKLRTAGDNYERKFDKKNLRLFRRLREKKSELLRKLRLGDKDERKEAIGGLAGFSFDDKVRKTLEAILLSEPEAELRKEVARAFAKVENKRAVAVLEKVKVEDPVEGVREEAERAIKEIQGR
jgi:hypothetical protein